MYKRITGFLLLVLLAALPALAAVHDIRGQTRFKEGLLVGTIGEKTAGAGVTIDGVTLVDGAVVTTGANITTKHIGAVNGATVTATEYGDGHYHVTRLLFTNTPLTVRDTEQGIGVKVYDFPEGRIGVVGVTGTATITTTSVILDTLNGGVTCNWGLGTTTQANGTLATTEQDLLPTTAITSSATIDVAGAKSSGALATMAQFDGTTTAKDIFLNLGVADGANIDANATVLVNGIVYVTWLFLGDLPTF